MDKNNSIRRALADICHTVYEKDMVCGSGGNISAKVNDKVLITPSGYSLGTIRVEDFVEVSMGGQVSGSVKPSVELFLHLKAYEARPDINAVVHVHSFYSILAGIMADANAPMPMPPYTPGYIMKVRNITQVPFRVPGTLELAEDVGHKLKDSDVVLMRNHGMIIVGKSLGEALCIAEEVEQNAKMHVMLNGKGFLSEEHIKAVCDKYTR